MAFDTRAALAREAISRLAGDRLEPHELLAEATARIRRVVPFDMGGCMTLDPDSLLPTGTLRTDKPPALVRDFWANELQSTDLHHFPTLAKAARPVATLRSVAPDRLEASARFQMHVDAGLTDEARVMFHGSDRSVWGAACLHREAGAKDFTEDERRFLATIAGDIGQALQRSLCRPPETSSLPAAPGVAILDRELRMTTLTAEAQQLLDLLPGDAYATLYGVAAGQTAGTRPARVRVRLRDGRWLLLHAADLQGGAGGVGGVAVVLERAPRADVASLLLRLHGLSAREQEVTHLLWKGRATDQIAGTLHISRHTLRDHVKAIFAKIGVTSRSELMAIAAGTAGCDPHAADAAAAAAEG
jgi:DNA-binding CsgD family transcriptional regulator